MGQVFKYAEDYIEDMQPGSVFVEIGSDRWEGSTEYLANLAEKLFTRLHTVDISAEAQNRVRHPAIDWHVEVGSTWCQNYQGRKIGCVYLDNFDYDWDINQVNSMIQEQKAAYLRDYGMTMNNQACQVEHMKQIVALTPHLATRCVVMFDDTYRYNDCWIGKCGPAVIYLLAQGFEIVRSEEREHGVILVRR